MLLMQNATKTTRDVNFEPITYLNVKHNLSSRGYGNILTKKWESGQDIKDQFDLTEYIAEKR
jgi:hypothetical protein